MKKLLTILLVLGVLGSLTAQVNAPKIVSPFSPFIAERSGLDSIQINPAGVRNGRRETVSAMAVGAMHTNVDEMMLLTDSHDTPTGTLTDLYTEFEARGQIGMSLNWLAFAVSQDMFMPVAFVESSWEDTWEGKTYYEYMPTIDQDAGFRSTPSAIAAMNIRLGGLVGGISGKTNLYVTPDGQFDGIDSIEIDAGVNLQMGKRAFIGAVADNLFYYDMIDQTLNQELPALNAGAALSLFDIGILEPFAAVDVFNLEQFVFADTFTDTTPTVRAMVGLEVFWMAEVRAQIITQPLLKETENESPDHYSVGFGLNLGIVELDAGFTFTDDFIDAMNDYTMENPPLTVDFLAKFNLGRKLN